MLPDSKTCQRVNKINIAIHETPQFKLGFFENRQIDKNIIISLPSIGESDPSLVKLKFPRNPGGENWGGLSCL